MGHEAQIRLDPDVAALLRRRIGEQDGDANSVINEALRRALGGVPTGARPRPARIKTVNTGLRPEADQVDANGAWLGLG